MTDPKHAPRAKRTPFVLLILGLMAGGLCLLLALNTASAANEVARHDLTADDQSAAAQLVDLENQVQASAAPANLAAAAAALGMVPAGNPGFLKIGKHDTVRVMGSAEPASLEPVVIPHPAPTPTKTPTSTKTLTKTSTRTPTTTKTAQKKTAKNAKTTPATTHGTTKQTHPTDTKTSTKTAAKTATTSTTPPPSPTPTPTPETTLPGGNR
jgi:outer membrane biosynthesis protein TonB